MAILVQKKRPALQAAEGVASDELNFEMPQPGDVFLVVAFIWSTICFLMVTLGDQLARRAAALTGSRVVRDLLLTEQTAIAAFMIIGIICIAAASFWFFNRYKLFASRAFCLRTGNRECRLAAYSRYIIRT